MRCLAVTSLLLLAAVLASVAPAAADKRGIRVGGKSAEDYVAEQTGKSWAVVIGINDYKDPKIRRLKYAVADAKAVGQELERRGFQVTYLLNQQATERGIKTELRTKLRQRAGKDDRVVIYYAGHGQDDKVEGTKTMGYILPVDGELDNVPGSGISMVLVKELADGLAAKQVLFLMDACYGGVAGQQTRALPKMTEAYLKQITREKGRQLITAGGADQEALEASDAGHGLFTYYLLRGLTEGHADLNDDGIVPTSELYAYLDSKVFTDAQMKGHTQRPELWTMSPEKGEFVFFTSAHPLPSPPPLAGEGRVGEGKVGGGPSAALTRKQQELAALEEEARRAEEETKQAELDRQIAEKRRQIEEQKKKKLEVASLPTPSLPRQTGREITGKDGAPMVLVPEGEFLYGDNKERRSLSAFYMDKYEVTTKFYAAFLQATNRAKPTYWNDVSLVSDGDRPVIGVTWHDADAYCRYYGKRLPTEQEWEKAARGTDGRKYPWGNEEPSSQHANFGKCCNWKGYATLASVESYEAGKSPYGFYHMAGNVWEWTSSDYESGAKVVRGGAWLDGANLLVSTLRGGWLPDPGGVNLGFRCVQDAR
jgi:formylglycine-generating enzyme required for sulfatase activity